MFSSNIHGEFKPRPRKFFGNGRSEDKLDIPDLMQKKSYDDFLQVGVDVADREDKGLESVLRSSFPISSQEGKATIDYISYRVGESKYDVWEALQRGVNYSAPLFITLRMIIWDIPEDNLDEMSDDEKLIHADHKHSADDAQLDSAKVNVTPSTLTNKEVKSIKEQEVYLGDIPIMTDVGSFVVNGAQRVIVSQMHRSPGVFYFRDDGKSNVAGKYIYSARVIPYKGLWLDIEFDSRDILYFRIDKKRKILLTTLLFAMGYTKERILREFYIVNRYRRRGDKWITSFNIDSLFGTVLDHDIVDADKGDIVLKQGDRITPSVKRRLKDASFDYIVPDSKLAGMYAVSQITDGEDILVDAGGVITFDALDLIKNVDHPLELVSIKDDSNYILETLALDKCDNKADALVEIYRVMKAGEHVVPEIAESFFQAMFYGEDRYDLSPVGRMKINMKHGFDVSKDYKYLRVEDIVAFIKHLILLKDGIGEVDDIDSLANRRVRCVGELLKNQFKVAMMRIERSIFERMNVVDLDAVMLHDLVNIKALSSTINEFFGTSQLSQFMDQTNPLSEVTHKRRVSSLGPGGLTRERASVDARDVHPTHYGRICPIETPEGQNIGLIGSLSSYAVINEYGFIESPYFKVENARVTDEIHYISAIEEAQYVIAQANEPLDASNCFASELVSCRKGGDFISASPSEVDYIDVSPKQLVSVAASMIPFLENDDASRALMGANMQRQAIPLLRGDAPLVGTGMEGVLAKSSGAAVFASRGGIVERVDSNRVLIRVNKDEYFDTESGSPFVVRDSSFASDQIDVYNILKYSRSNNNTVINQRVVVNLGDEVKAGQLIADSASTDCGELGLGKNVLVAFMPWNGYNFEDSILISERVVRDDVFTSIQVQQYDVIARDTMLGPEEITRSIPGVSEAELSALDESGIVNVGATVKPNDIIVGKVVPKSEAPLMPEEKLLRAIFGDKVADVKDASLRVPPGDGGTVIGAWVFTRRGIEKSERAIASEKIKIDQKVRHHADLLQSVTSAVYDRLEDMLVGQALAEEDKAFSESVITAHDLNLISNEKWWDIKIKDEKLSEEIERIRERFESTKASMHDEMERSVERVQSGDDLAHGALQVVKVLIAKKMKLQPGDKMAGRHGNKGVVSKIVPVEDMPFLEDGTPVDIVLNPIGVPSRMNVGQILETHLGWASVMLGKQFSDIVNKYMETQDPQYTSELKSKLARVYESDGRWPGGDALNFDPTTASDEEVIDIANRVSKGVPFATPVFDGAKEENINDMLREAGVPVSGQVKLMDGRTGEFFDRDVTVGYIYMMKLDHLVENKVHARSIGAYSLVTQQPLGGKSHFGGQRFGEMECWALQAYGAAYTLQEMLTVKSDDVSGRVKMYEQIVKGDSTFDCGVPESFNVMIKELRSLCINIEGINTDDRKNAANGGALLADQSDNTLGAKNADNTIADTSYNDSMAQNAADEDVSGILMDEDGL